mmetsp:Transcript_5665/g.16180  ORF Transcript_5665/g.16180 Transcript_5665/m.16180 type:complete len:100 (-) Transcript_5665:205-504(-)
MRATRRPALFDSAGKPGAPSAAGNPHAQQQPTRLIAGAGPTCLNVTASSSQSQDRIRSASVQNNGGQVGRASEWLQLQQWRQQIAALPPLHRSLQEKAR